ncbi:MAG: DUF4276 family protein [Paramuribaculum sp.]|nr:DUF4276 family protein [Paramuribaculum sp.]
MSRRLFIVVEGQTEEEFMKEVLRPYLSQFGLFDVRPVLIKTSPTQKGGFVSYDHLRNHVGRLLKSEGSNIVVTTFVDFFRAPTFPHEERWKVIADHHRRVEMMERVCEEDINDSRFLPYIQLHEFEALLFSSVNGYIGWFDEKVVQKIGEVVDEYDDPEEINSRPESAPSKRLIGIINGYDKIVYGNLIAMGIGIDGILAKCPRFRGWVERLVERCR